MKKISKFKEDDLVRVVSGIKDPDFKTNIGGWTGIVEEIDLSDNGSWLYAIRWNKETLSKAGTDYIEKCENENLDYEIIFLGENELELVNERSSENDGTSFV